MGPGFDPQDQVTMRWTAFLVLCLSGWLWSRRRWGPAAGLFLVTQGMAVLFWTLPLRGPVGLEADRGIQETWARAAVAYQTGDSTAGYVIGTHAPPTALARLSAAGVPPETLRAGIVWLPVGFIALFAIASGGISGSRPRRLFTAALSSTFAPLWGNVVDASPLVVTEPETALVVLTLLAASIVALWCVSSHRRTLPVVGVVFGSLAAGSWASAGTISEWLLLGATPLFAILLVPALRTAASSLRSPGIRRTAIEGLVLVFIGGGSSWFWWEPVRTVVGFSDACAGMPALQAPLQWINQSTPPHARIASTPEYAALIPALTGRQTLMAAGPDASVGQARRRSRLLESLQTGRADLALVRRFEVTHFFAGPGEPDPPVVDEGGGGTAPRVRLRLLYSDGFDFRVFEVRVDPG